MIEPKLQEPSSERRATAMHEALHGLAFALFGYPCTITIFNDRGGQTVPNDLLKTYDAAHLMVVALSGALGSYMQEAIRSESAFAADAGRNAFIRISENPLDYGADKMSLVQNIKNVFGEQNPESNKAVLDLISEYIKDVLEIPAVKTAAEEIAYMLCKYPEVALRCDTVHFWAEPTNANSPTAPLDEIDLTIKSGLTSIDSFRQKWYALLSWKGSHEPNLLGN